MGLSNTAYPVNLKGFNMSNKAELQAELANVVRQNGQTGVMLRHVIDLINDQVTINGREGVDSLHVNVSIGNHCVPVYAITMQNALHMQMNRNEERVKQIMKELDKLA